MALINCLWARCNRLPGAARRMRLVLIVAALASFAMADDSPVRVHNVELPGQDRNVVGTSWPGIACWFWTADEFAPEGYKPFIDLHVKHTGVQILTTSIRHPVEVTDAAVHRQIKAAAAYARSRGIELAVDLDVRLARAAFMNRYPNEMQELASLREFPMKASGNLELTVASPNFGDHYTYRSPSYYCLGSRFLRAYSYRATDAGIDPASIADISDRTLIVETSPQKLRAVVRCGPEDAGRTMCLISAFTLFTPDVFAPHLLAFERAILEQYAEVPMIGACKDEWGFPGRFTVSADDLWYSEAMAKSYEAEYGVEDFVRTLFLMWKNRPGNEPERVRAINQYMELCRLRNVEVEAGFYRAVKDTFGAQALVATHPTWYPVPSDRELFKNGLHWWAAPRDLAQTDESTPYAARTALAKKWHSPLWYNMYYDSELGPYEEDLWRHVLGGGRMNLHPMFPRSDSSLTTSLLSSRLFQAEARIRLLNYISTAPVDCPVAVIFGHPAAANWAWGGFGDVGLDVTNALWEAGMYADLIPTSEIGAGLGIGPDGHIEYGPQRYAAAVLYHPQYERGEIAEFFQQAAGGKTALFQVGEWSVDFHGQPLDGAAALPQAIHAGDTSAVVAAVLAHLAEAGIEAQTRGTMRGASVHPGSMMPEPEGQCRLLDGTVIFASGRKDVMGDPLRRTLQLNGRDVSFDAVGLAALRFADNGALEAMAAGGLKTFEAGGMAISLDERVDLALWRDGGGQWRGVVHGAAAIPEALEEITLEWTRVDVPAPLDEPGLRGSE
jgi:hypothetical protein